jgi:hypothetical protein
LAAFTSVAASYRTPNFLVTAPSGRLAQKIGDSAEAFRRELAILWLGKELPRWQSPCPISAQVEPHLGAGGATSFVFQNGQVGGWRMSIQGSEVRILDSVLPHEVTHTIFATHFRQPLPRWADEGACTTVEHQSEKERHRRMLISFLKTNRGIAFSRMLMMKEYPPDVLPLYAEGYSLARFLIEQGGRRKFVDFIGDGLRDENWYRALNASYGVQSLAGLQNTWLEWVKRGSPSLLPASTTSPPITAVADNSKRQRLSPNLVHRVGRGETDRRLAETRASSQQSAPPRGTSAGRGWYAPGKRAAGASAFAPGSIASAVPPTTAPITNQHSAVRQQPIQRPKQTVLR